ncbi:MAG: hypothetical protein HN348_18385 [Proteobacteria bacterium]|nr:hypothetical protein [Pseudomonadota bacterium]
MLCSVSYAGPGDHIRVGDAVIAPRIALGFEYRTNPAQMASDVIGGPDMTISPSLDISAEGPELAFGFGGKWAMRKFFGPKLTSLDRYSDFTINGDFDVFRKRVVGFKIRENCALLGDPNEDLLYGNPALEVNQPAYHTRFRNQMGGALVLRAGPTLEFDLGASWAFDDYSTASNNTTASEDAKVKLESLNRRHTYGPEITALWTFFPRSALVLDGEYLFNSWADNSIDTSGNSSESLGDSLEIPNSQHFKIMTGLRGRLTERMVVILMLGYGTGNYGDKSLNVSGVDGLLTTLQLRYDLGASHKLSVGYQKGFLDSFFTNYVSYNYIHAGLESRYGTRFGSNIKILTRFEGYEGQVERNDILLQAQGDFSVDLADWATLSTGVWWIERGSNTSSVEYDDVNIHLLAGFTY